MHQRLSNRSGKKNKIRYMNLIFCSLNSLIFVSLEDEGPVDVSGNGKENAEHEH